jgi:hypothetical protein
MDQVVSSIGQWDEKGTTSFGRETKGNYSPNNEVVSIAVL